MSDRIEGLAGLVIWTTAERYAAMRAFYVDTLGLAPRSDRDGFVSFVLSAPDGPDDVRLNVSVHREIEGAARDPLRIMLLLRVDDIHATAARLQSAGVVFMRPPEQEPWGGWIATFPDPDGNVVQLLQPAG
jgi:predicted enzyme related to lactoylglutathione lyase